MPRGLKFALSSLLAGPAQMKVFYPGEDKIFEPASNVADFVVEPEITKLTLVSTGSGGNRRLTATLLDDDGTPVRDRTIEFSADGNRICEGVEPTNGNGVTTCDPPSKYQGGKRTYQAVFRSDGYYAGSSS